MQTSIKKKTQKNVKIRPYANHRKKQIKHKHKNKPKHKQNTKKNKHVYATCVFRFMFCLCFVCVSLVFFYVCQNPKILFSQNKILDFCLTQVLRKQNVCQTYVKHVGDISFTLAAGCTRFGFQIGNCLTQGDGQLMFHICCKFHTHVLLYVSLMFQLYSIYVSFAFHICFVMFDICFIYVSHMFRLCFTYDIRPSTGLYVCGQHTPTSRHVRVHVAVHVAVHVRDHVKDMAHNKPK